jgi:lysophospholipase L1-like esterase
MARKLQATAAAFAAAGLLILLSVPAPRGQTPPAPAPVAPAAPVMPAPFSRDCQVGAAADLSASPLPNVAAALQKRKVIKILAIGASALSGLRGRGGSYTGEIERLLEQAVKGLDVVIVNRGVSGELAADAARRIQTAVALHEPDLVLWQVGTNDALAYVPIDELRDTIVETIRWLKAHNVDVVLAGLQFVTRLAQDDYYRTVRELIRSIAEQEKVVVVRRREAMRLLGQASQSGGGLFPEEFAQTELGYACLAEYVARVITLGAFGRGLRDQPPRR